MAIDTAPPARGLAQPVRLGRPTAAATERADAPQGEDRRRSSVAVLWSDLGAARRLAVVALAAVATALLGIALYLTVESRASLVEATGQDLLEEVSASSALPLLDSAAGSTAAGVDQLELTLDRLLGHNGIHASLWSLDATLLSTAGMPVPELGAREDLKSRLAQATKTGVVSVVSDSTDGYTAPGGRQVTLVEHYLRIADPASGRPVAILELHEDMGLLDAALAQAQAVTRGVLLAGLLTAAAAIVVLLVTALRSTDEQRRRADTRAREFAVLSRTAEAVAISLEPDRMLVGLRHRLVDGLGLDRLDLRPTDADPGEGSSATQLRNGAQLVAVREAPLTVEEKRILEAAGHSYDAAAQNAALYLEVKRAAADRQELIRRVAVAHEDERKRLVGELHDTLASDLIRTLYAVRRTQQLGTDPAFRDSIGAVERSLQDAETRLRSFMNRVRPMALDVSGLVAAVRDVVARFDADSDLAVRARVPRGAGSAPRIGTGCRGAGARGGDQEHRQARAGHEGQRYADRDR